MAISTELSVVQYAGNGSAITAYVIPFPFLAVGDIKLAISPDGVAAFVEQSSPAFLVTRNSDGQGGFLVTTAAHSAPKVLKIYRKIAFTQPSVFQPQGPFPAKTAETALDRLEMQIQQLAALISGAIPGAGAGTGSGKSWLNAAARSLVTPDFIGQAGTEQETQTVWIAQSTAAGDWVEYRPMRTNKLVIGYTADAGSPSSWQTSIANLFGDWAVGAAFFGGDNNYNGAAAYNADWAAFDNFVSGGIAYPALGNHDIDETGWQARLDAKFPYLPGNRRYYKVTLGDGLVDLFVLNSGRDSIWDLLEPDGNSSSSVQHTWFVAALATSRARWKIAMFHHPPASAVLSTSNRIEPNMAWPELSRMDLILCGHTHILEVIKWSGVQIANISAAVFPDNDEGAVVQGGAISDAILWVDDEGQACSRILATDSRLIVEVWEIGQLYGANRLLHVREAHDFTRPPIKTQTFVTHAPEVAVADTGTIYVTTLPQATVLREVQIANVITGNQVLTWTLKGGVVTLATGTIAANVYTGKKQCVVPDDVIPRNTVISLEWSKPVADARTGMSASLIFDRWK